MIEESPDRTRDSIEHRTKIRKRHVFRPSVGSWCHPLPEDQMEKHKFFVKNLPEPYKDGSLSAYFVEGGVKGLAENKVVLKASEGDLVGYVTFDNPSVARNVAASSHKWGDGYAAVQIEVHQSEASSKICVKKLPRSYGDGQLQAYFGQFGNIVEATILVEPCKGLLFGYISIGSRLGARQAEDVACRLKFSSNDLNLSVCEPQADMALDTFPTEAEQKAECESVANSLGSKGFTVKWLIEFWRKYAEPPPELNIATKILEPALGAWRSTIDRETPTKVVVRDIVIPETWSATSKKHCCYMDLVPGSATKPEKLVSHSWEASFFGDVICILQDATGMTGEDVMRYLNYDYLPPGFEMDMNSLNRSYWMCIFAVNQHISICGMCNDCNVVNTGSVCRVCGLKLYNPCSCGSLKFKTNHSQCQMDKFSMVMSMIDELLVALDAKLGTMRRVWILSEIGTSIHEGKKIEWQLPHIPEANLSAFCEEPDTNVPSVRDCHSSLPEDKIRILNEIEGTVGIERFDENVAAAIKRVLPDVALSWCISVCGQVGHVKNVDYVKNVLARKADANLLMRKASRVDHVKNVLARKADANLMMRKASSRTALFEAARRGNVDLVKALHFSKADVDAEDSIGAMPLAIASQQGLVDVVNCLIELQAGVEKAGRANYLPIMLAAQTGHADVVTTLACNNANVETCREDAGSPLAMACFGNHHDAALALIHARANIDATGEHSGQRGWPPLIMAVYYQHSSMVQQLLTSSANPNITCEEGARHSALTMAAWFGHDEVCRQLLEAKADIHYRASQSDELCYCTTHGGNALDIARERHRDLVVKYLEHVLSISQDC